MNDVIIRKADGNDINTLLIFNCRMAKETEGKTLDKDTLVKGIKAVIKDNKKGFYLIATEKKRTVGALLITKEWSDWRNGEFWWIQSVYVIPEHRRKGIYRQLYTEVKALAGMKKEVIGFRLYVEKDNKKAQSTYKSLGMQETNYYMFEESDDQ